MNRKYMVIWLMCLPLVFVAGSGSGAQSRLNLLGKKGTLQKAENMKTLKLRNGVQAVLEENHSAPVVAVQVWVKAGSGDESDPQAGMAHVIEHMMFKGSAKFPSGEMASQIEGKGGILNAFTTSDFTVYWTVISSRFFETGLDLFSDSIYYPRFDEEELEREREVVLEEIRRQEDSPRSRLYDQLMKVAYRSYPYRRPVIGYQETVSGFEHDDLAKFFNCQYRPGNMVVVMAGDFDTSRAAELLKQYFGGEKPADGCSESDQRKISEPAQNELRVALSQGQVNRGYLYMAYKIPAFGDPDMAALDLLSTILGQGESSRLSETVRNQKKLVDEIFAYANTPRGPGLMLLGASLDPKNLEPASRGIIEQVNRIRKEGVADWELERAKRQIESDAIYSRETMEGNARRIGFFAAIINDPGFEKKYLDQVEKTTAADLRKVAEKYLVVSNLSFAAMLPEVKPGDESALEQALRDSADKTPDQPPTGEKQPEASARLWPIPAAGNGPKLSEPARFSLSNGISVLVRENHYVPIVSARAGFPGGVRFEDEQSNGVFNLMAEMLTEGTREMSSAEIHRRIEALAAVISGFSGRNSFGLTMSAPSPNFDASLALFAQLLKGPAFPKKDLERVRGQVLASLKREQDQPRVLINNLFAQTLFTRHPYRLNPLGSEDSVKKFKRDDLVNAYRKFALSRNLVIAVSGDVNAEELKDKLERLFADFNNAAPAAKPPEAEPAPASPREKEMFRDGAQAQIMFGWLGTTMSAPDQPALEVMTEMLAGMSGRLFVELRDKKSLAYEVSAYHLEGIEPGYIAGYIGCAPEKKDEAVRGMLAEFEKMTNQAASPEEITRAKNSLIGSHEIDLQHNMTIATHMFFDELYELGFNHWQGYAARVEKVSAQDIEAAARKYLTNRHVLAVINPKAEPQPKAAVRKK